VLINLTEVQALNSSYFRFMRQCVPLCELEKGCNAIVHGHYNMQKLIIICLKYHQEDSLYTLVKCQNTKSLRLDTYIKYLCGLCFIFFWCHLLTEHFIWSDTQSVHSLGWNFQELVRFILFLI